MSWTEVGDADNGWTVTASASTSFSEQADASTTFELVGKDNGYVLVDYVVDSYIDQGESFTVISTSDNTWSAA